MAQISDVLTTVVFVICVGSSISQETGPGPCPPPPLSNIISQLLTLYRIALSQKASQFPPLPCAAVMRAIGSPELQQQGPLSSLLPPSSPFLSPPQLPLPQAFTLPQFLPLPVSSPSQYRPASTQNDPTPGQPRVVYVSSEVFNQGYPSIESTEIPPFRPGCPCRQEPPINNQYVPRSVSSPRLFNPAQLNQYFQPQIVLSPQAAAQARQTLTDPLPQLIQYQTPGVQNPQMTQHTLPGPLTPCQAEAQARQTRAHYPSQFFQFQTPVARNPQIFQQVPVPSLLTPCQAAAQARQTQTDPSPQLSQYQTPVAHNLQIARQAPVPSQLTPCQAALARQAQTIPSPRNSQYPVAQNSQVVQQTPVTWPIIPSQSTQHRVIPSSQEGLQAPQRSDTPQAIQYQQIVQSYPASAQQQTAPRGTYQNVQYQYQ